MPARREQSLMLPLYWAVPITLLAAAAYELALLLDLWGSYDSARDGSARDGFVDAGGTVAGVAYLTMLVGSVVAFVHAMRPRAPWAVALFAPAAAAFMTAKFYTYDPYYLPSLRRYSDDGAASAEWILGLLAVSLAVGASARLLPRAGSFATAFILPWLLIASLLASAGH